MPWRVVLFGAVLQLVVSSSGLAQEVGLQDIECSACPGQGLPEVSDDPKPPSIPWGEIGAPDFPGSACNEQGQVVPPGQGATSEHVDQFEMIETIEQSIDRVEDLMPQTDLTYDACNGNVQGTLAGKTVETNLALGQWSNLMPPFAYAQNGLVVQGGATNPMLILQRDEVYLSAQEPNGDLEGRLLVELIRLLVQTGVAGDCLLAMASEPSCDREFEVALTRLALKALCDRYCSSILEDDEAEALSREIQKLQERLTSLLDEADDDHTECVVCASVDEVPPLEPQGADACPCQQG